MKKLLLVAALFMCCLTYVQAQPRAIGAKIGYGIDISYEHSIGEKNMVSAELGFPCFLGVEAAATYDWIFPISRWEKKGTWNWYAGVGGAAGIYWGGIGSVGAAGRIGVEYNFDFPLQLSVDYRPVIGPAFDSTGAYFFSGGLYSGGIGVRYLF